MSRHDHSSRHVDVFRDSHELEKFYRRLINEVKKHQLLFDSSSALYRVAAARNRVWENIAAAFGDEYNGRDQKTSLPIVRPSLAAIELRTKWRSIRDRYIRERRIYKESLSEGIPRWPKWALYSEFAFLDSYVEGLPLRALDNNNDAESVQSEGRAASLCGLASSGNEEADQSSPSSSASTPSTLAGGGDQNEVPVDSTPTAMQIFQRALADQLERGADLSARLRGVSSQVRMISAVCNH